MQTLPLVPSLPNYRFGTTLEGEEYVFDIRWNSREESWYMSIFDGEANPIRQNIKIVLGVKLGKRVTHADFPPGAMVAVDTTNRGIEAKYDDLGERVIVVYLSSAEVAEFKAG